MCLWVTGALSRQSRKMLQSDSNSVAGTADTCSGLVNSDLGPTFVIWFYCFLGL